MKNLSSTTLLFLFILIFSLASCTKDWIGVPGHGEIHTENRNIDGFNGVDFQLGGHVNIVQDSIFSVSVTAYDNYQNLIRTYVQDGKLVINSTKSLKDDNSTIEIHLPYLNYLNLGGSGSINTVSHFNSTSMKVQITGSGTIDYAGDVNSLIANVSGSGKISLWGTSDNASMKMSGSGKIKGYAMQILKNDATISGSGTIETYVLNELNVNISGSGKVYYMGNPMVNTSITGSGKVIHQ